MTLPSKKNESLLNQETVKKLFNYDPVTGHFTRRAPAGGTVKRGDLAGSIDKKGYIVIFVKRKIYKAHRLAWLYMTGEWPEHQIDHINHIRNDNRFCNLREASNVDNSRNKSIRDSSVSGVNGVCMHSNGKKWQSKIKVKGKDIYLGVFFCMFDAICARKSAERKYGFHENHGK